jgi:hypothetical protein
VRRIIAGCRSRSGNSKPRRSVSAGAGEALLASVVGCLPKMGISVDWLAAYMRPLGPVNAGHK